MGVHSLSIQQPISTVVNINLHEYKLNLGDCLRIAIQRQALLSTFKARLSFHDFKFSNTTDLGYPKMGLLSLSFQQLIVISTVVIAEVVGSSGQLTSNPKFSREDFPSDFVFGAGSSAYQIEGAVAEDGRTPSIWDIFTHAGNMPDKSTADITADGYHKYKEDVKIMSAIGLEAYRFSISWSRLLPQGRGAINKKGLQFYKDLIDELVNHGIEPHVTLYHLDLPQVLEDEYSGWLSPKIIEDFTQYADLCFREFGDRVSHWTTINQPNILSKAGYDCGPFPPHRCSQPGGVNNFTGGNSSVEPYIVMHHALLAHASAVAVYRENYQVKQKGSIGLNIYAMWCIPLTNSTADIEATQRAIDFNNGWAVRPLVFGDYPECMKKKAGSRIPSFTTKEAQLVKGSFDFIGLNHYVTVYVEDDPKSNPTDGPGDYISDAGVKFSRTGEETPSGSFIPSSPTYHPFGLQKLLEYFKDHYGNPAVYIHENGFGAPSNESLNDTERIHYLSGYIQSVLEAIRNGSDTRGYFVWSFLDVFELLGGYTTRCGLVHVDFEDKELERKAKLSAHWYSNFIKKNDVFTKKTISDRSSSLSE